MKITKNSIEITVDELYKLVSVLPKRVSQPILEQIVELCSTTQATTTQPLPESTEIELPSTNKIGCRANNQPKWGTDIVFSPKWMEWAEHITNQVNALTKERERTK